MAAKKKPLEPLIPLDKLKQIVGGLIAVPKAPMVKPKPERKAGRKSRGGKV